MGGFATSPSTNCDCCDEPLTYCCPYLVPDSWDVTISGVGGGHACCTFVNNTFNFVLTDEENCRWDGFESGALCGVGLSTDMWLQITESGGGTVVLSVNFRIRSLPFFTTVYLLSFAKSFPRPIDCCSFENEVIDFFSNSVNAISCTDSGYTCTVTANCGASGAFGAAATLAGAGTYISTSEGTSDLFSVASLSGSGSFSDAYLGEGTLFSVATLEGAATYVSSSTGTAALTAVASLSGTGTYTSLSTGTGALTAGASLSGTGSYSSGTEGTGALLSAASISGAGEYRSSSTGTGALSAGATLSGTGAYISSSTGTSTLSAGATLSGSAEYYSNSTGTGNLNAGAVLSGSADYISESEGTGELFSVAILSGDAAVSTHCYDTDCCDRPLPGEGGNQLPTTLRIEVLEDYCPCLDSISESAGVPCLEAIDGQDMTWNGVDGWELQASIFCNDPENPEAEQCELSSEMFTLQCAALDDCEDFWITLNGVAGCDSSGAVYPRPGGTCDPFDMTFDIPVSGCVGTETPCTLPLRIFEL